MSSANPPTRLESRDTAMSLYHLLDPEVLANPYPLFQRMRSEDPVHWDPFLHAWVVTRYADVLEVLHHVFRRSHAHSGTTGRDGTVGTESDRQRDGEADAVYGRTRAYAVAGIVVEGVHSGARGTAARAHSGHRQESAGSVEAKGEMDVIADLAEPLPAIVTAEMLGVPANDHRAVEAVVGEFRRDAGKFSAQSGTFRRRFWQRWQA